MQENNPFYQLPEPQAPSEQPVDFIPPPPELPASESPHIGSGDDSGENNNLFSSVTPIVTILVLAPLIALMIIKYGFQSYVVDGASMDPTLHDQEFLIISKAPRTLARLTGNAYIPERGDIVVFNDTIARQYIGGEQAQFIKRVIGLPGDRVRVMNGVITVYNAAYPEGFQPDLNPEYTAAISATPGTVDVTVGENEVFVCGDNRNNSLDSRAFGPISADEIVGKLSLRLSPLNKIQRF